MKSEASHAVILLAVCFFVFWWRLGTLGLIDPDEPFYAQSSHEMVRSGDWITPQIYGQPQFEKPVFYYWLVAASFRVFGENEFSGRLPSALFGTLAVLLTWAFARRVFGARAGLLAGLILATGLEFGIMSRLMLTDVPLAFFVAGSVFGFYLAQIEPEKRERWIFAALVCSALAALTKGPVGSIIPLLAVLSFSFVKKNGLHLGIGFWSGFAAYALIVVPWYALMFAKFGEQFWDEFFIRDNWLRFIRAEHPANNHFWYYIGVLMLGSIPWMPLVLLAVWRRVKREAQSDGALFVWCWLLSSLAFLTIAQSKLPSYCVFLFIPVALLAGITADSLLSFGFLGKGERALVIAVAAMQCAVPFVVPMMKVAKPFAVPALLLGACLAVAFALLFARKLAGWIAASALGAMAMIFTAVTFTYEHVEELTSVRPAAARVAQLRKTDEPVLASKFLVRGIYYNNTRDGGGAIFVLADKAQPFWAAHPLPVVVWKNGGLTQFLAQHPAALCAMRKSEWETLGNYDAFKDRDAFEEIGDSVIVRAHAVRRAK